MKSGVIKTMLISTIALGSFFGTINANAACSVGGLIVERVLSYANSTYIYMRAPVLQNSYYYYAITSSDKIAALAAAAQTARTTVNAYGTVSTCPTNSSGARALGTLSYLYMVN